MRGVSVATEPLALYRDLRERVVVVTGGASGIGAALVRAFRAQGSRVHLLDRDAERGSLVAHASGARFHACDLTDIDALRQTLAEIEAAETRIDVLLNNAGNDDRHALDTVEPGYWRERFALNLDHAFFAAQAVAGGMRARGSGSIVMTSSTSWMKGRPGMVGYTTAKAALVGLTRTLSRELGPAGVRVNCIVPGAVSTERQTTLWRTEAARREILDAQALPIDLQPDHVAHMALFLGSEASAGCTGAQFLVDAGIS